MSDPTRGCEHGGHVRCRACCDADYERRIAALEAEVAKARAVDREAPWFLLFDGQSADGMGEGAYVGRTTDVAVARRHYEKCRENPYSTGSVLIVTPTERTRARHDTKWDSYIQRRAPERETPNRWVRLRATSPSGKSLFVCLCCGIVSPAPLKRCVTFADPGEKWGCSTWSPDQRRAQEASGE